MNEDNKNNFILVDEDKPKEKKWKKIVKILLVVAIVCSFAMNGYVFYNMMSSSSDSTTTVTNKGTVKQVNYDVKTLLILYDVLICRRKESYKRPQ